MTMPNLWTGLLNRRDLLKIGSVGIAATLLPDGVRASPHRHASADSIILLNMMGGVTHIDSFDPKPDAPEEIRGTNGTVQTAIPGVRFGEVLPRMAALTRHFCLLRSFSHDSNDHLLSQVYMLSGRKVTMAQLMTEPNIGSIVAHLQGPRAGFPGTEDGRSRDDDQDERHERRGQSRLLQPMGEVPTVPHPRTSARGEAHEGYQQEVEYGEEQGDATDGIEEEQDPEEMA
ncbi:MAG: DUF1501 domain-containing protein, partial [Planctomycetes bacterium]|nr:DUF1501 domain-containing protein [Planctomycetota bacterium]